MTPTILLGALRSRGVLLTVKGDTLTLDAPKGVLTDELHQDIRQHKAALLDLLEAWEERAAIAEYDGRLPREVAEALAWSVVLQTARGGADSFSEEQGHERAV